MCFTLLVCIPLATSTLFTLSLHDALPICGAVRDKLLGYPHHERDWVVVGARPNELEAKGFVPVGKDFPVFLHPDTKDRKSTRLNSSHVAISYAVFCLK